MTGIQQRLGAALADRYRIERELGQGGMATVYLAQDIRHDRKVALKVLRPELAAVLGADRFVVEIKTTASLQHPHILPLFDWGPWMVSCFTSCPTFRAKRSAPNSIAKPSLASTKRYGSPATSRTLSTTPTAMG